MEFSSDFRDRTGEIVSLFRQVFAAAEGADEGALIGALARDLIATTAPADILVFSALEDGALVGCVVFSRLIYPEDARTVFLLAPVAVRTDRQGMGVGRALLGHALGEIAARGGDVVITYGDPRYYGRVGFRPITVREAAPPLVPSHPEGWLGQSLTDAPFTPLKGPSRCVAALRDPAFW